MVTPPFPSLSWRGGFNPPVLAACVLLLAINWFVSTETIEACARCTAYSEFVRAQLLRISPYADIWAHARTTMFPSSALFSHAVFWGLVVLLATYNFSIVALNSRAYALHGLKVWASWSHKEKWVPAWFIFVMILALWVLTMMPGNMAHTASADLKSRVFFGFISTCTFVSWHLATFYYSLLVFSFLFSLFNRESS